MISILLPAFNAEAFIESNVHDAASAADAVSDAFEIILVDDASTDSTAEIGQRLAELPHVQYHRYDTGPTKRENLARSICRARGDTIVFIDGDLPVDLEALPDLLSYVQGEYDIATGSRRLGITPDRGLIRQCLTWIYNRYLRLRFASSIHDHQCGFKAFKRQAVLDLIDEMGFDSTGRRGWFWDGELLLRAQRRGLRIKEFPVHWSEGKGSTFRIDTALVLYILRFSLPKKE